VAQRRQARDAAVVLQRSWLKRAPALRARKRAQHAAATKLQARRRGSIGRARAAKKKRWRKGWVEPTAAAQHKGAGVLSRALRRRGTQKKVAKIKAAAAKIQTLGRRRTALKAVAAQKVAVKKQRSSVAIQTRVRARQAKKRQSKAKAAHVAAFFLALALQCRYRLLDAKRALALRKYLATVGAAGLLPSP
jgi:hypothetical protein